MSLSFFKVMFLCVCSQRLRRKYYVDLYLSFLYRKSNMHQQNTMNDKDKISVKNVLLFFFWSCCPTRAMASSFMRFLDHTRQHTTVGRTPLDEWSVRRRDLYLTIHNTYKGKTSTSPAGFEPKISAGGRPQIYAFDRAATGAAKKNVINITKSVI